MEKLQEEKVFRDPIHGYVRVQYKVIWDCIITKEMQRLRRVKQLGSTSFVYHTGEHSRFAHSLGVYEIVRRMISEVSDLANCLTEYEKICVMLAGLLHDVGHAPFSHSFESITKTNHEYYTMQLIKSNSQIADVLDKYDTNLKNDICSIIDGSYHNQILCQLISSQLDADRMDYLLRDSYFTGTAYGQFDLERVLRTMRVCQDKLVIKQSGIHTIEDYIMARYHMYWQVYYHNVSRSFEAVLNRLFTRLRDLSQYDNTYLEKYPMYKALLSKEVLSNDEFFLLDDGCCWYSFILMQQDEDKVLADLAQRIIERNLFGFKDIAYCQEIKNKLINSNYPIEYYLYTDQQKQSPYKPYSKNPSHYIWILQQDGTVEELSKVSNIVSSICNDQTSDEKVFYPKEINY